MKWVVLLVVVPVLWFLGALFSGLTDSSFSSRIGIEVEEALEDPFKELGIDLRDFAGGSLSAGDFDPKRVCLPFPTFSRMTSNSGLGVSYSLVEGQVDLAQTPITAWPAEAFATEIAAERDTFQCHVARSSYNYSLNYFTLANHVAFAERYLLPESAMEKLRTDQDFFGRYFSSNGEENPANFVARMNDAYSERIAPFEVEYRIEGNVFAFRLIGTRPAHVNGTWWLAIILAVGSVLFIWLEFMAKREDKVQVSPNE